MHKHLAKTDTGIAIWENPYFEKMIIIIEDKSVKGRRRNGISNK